MYQENGRFSRREFNHGLIGGALAGYLAYQLRDNLPQLPELATTSPTSLSQLLEYERSYLNPPHKDLIGSLINIPFAAYYADPIMVRRIAENMMSMDCKLARLYVPNEFERTTGRYKLEYLSKLASFISELYRHSNGVIKCVVVIEDTFNLLHSNKQNSSYGSRPLNHHALKGSVKPDEIKKYQKDYFTKEVSINAFIKRAQIIMNFMRNLPNIVAWEVVNEPEITFETDDPKAALTEWYSKVTPHIKDRDPDKPTISGVKNPQLIDAASLVTFGLDHNSAHIYDAHSIEQFDVAAYILEMQTNPDLPPLILDEMGLSQNYNFFRLPKTIHDRSLAQLVTKLVLNNSIIDLNNHTMQLPIAHFGVWQLDAGPINRDGFQFDPEVYPHMTDAMKTLGSVLTLD